MAGCASLVACTSAELTYLHLPMYVQYVPAPLYVFQTLTQVRKIHALHLFVCFVVRMYASISQLYRTYTTVRSVSMPGRVLLSLAQYSFYACKHS